MNGIATAYPAHQFVLNGTIGQSYIDFSNAFERGIRYFLDFVQNEFPYNGDNSYTDGQCSSKALYWSNDSLKAPQSLSLEDTFALSSSAMLNSPQSTTLYYDSQRMPEQNTVYSKINSLITPILKVWHPGQKTAIRQINIQTEILDDRYFNAYDLVKNLNLRTEPAPILGESYHYAIALLSPKDNPLIQGEVWELKSGREVQLVRVHDLNHDCEAAELEIEVVDAKTFEYFKVRKNDLLQPKCYSYKTNQIVPGLLLDVEKAASLRNKNIDFINGCRFIQKTMRDDVIYNKEMHVQDLIRLQFEQFAKENTVYLPSNETTFFNPRFQVYGDPNKKAALEDRPSCGNRLFSRMLNIAYEILGN